MRIENITTSVDNEFYPTPEHFAKEILKNVDWYQVGTILEPSAGKGDLLGPVKSWFKDKYRSEPDIDCIESDTNLQHILRGEGYRVVYNDFLSFNTYKTYDLILMNPPFSNGDKHLLKALDMQKKGGSIICILNAETIKNPYTNSRKELARLLDKYSATIKYYSDMFISAERPTGVEVAVINIYIPKIKEESEIYEKLKKAKQHEKIEEADITDVTLSDYIKAAVKQFEVETASGIELIRQYINLKPYILRSLDENETYNTPTLSLRINDSKHDEADINGYLKKVRYKYWKALFANSKFTRRLTSDLQDEYRGMVDELMDFDFNEYNIDMLVADMNSKISKGIEDAIIKMFDKMSVGHAYWGKESNNIHYYNGWKTNKAHKINKKVIMPCYDVFEDRRWGGSFRPYRAISALQDIEKCLNFLDGHMTREVDLYDVIERAKENPKNIECKFFKVTFFKKGTMHITFSNLELLEKFNIYAAQNKKWLPPNYGKKQYKDMSSEEQKVIESFQGEAKYNEIFKKSSYYLTKEKDLLQITG